MFAALPTEAIRELAEHHGVCTRPVVHQVTDVTTGQVRLIPTSCGATLASKCLPCAHRNRVLRMQQCREGWHLELEPISEEPVPNPPAEDDQAGDEPEPARRRGRSTRRRPDVPDLPRMPVDKRTVGMAFTTASGKVYRPSMFVTFTLPSYGRVHADGTPVDPSTYDYRRAALDALHFPKLIDRVWQNLRRATGYQVQYFSAVEAQRRLAPHLHAAIRGAIPRAVLRTVAGATYHQVWWPAHDEARYVWPRLPAWVDGVGYVDPMTRRVLPTWVEALAALDDDADAEPAHTLRLGRQLDIQGIIASEGDADRRVAYLTKYLAKSFGEAIGDADGLSRRQRVHLDRLHEEVRFLPCWPRCWNWLRFGIQPQGAEAGMTPGSCPAKAHDREHLGCGGRRVLVSRKWSGKTLSRHRADRAEVVRQTLLAAGVDVPETGRLSADVEGPDGRPRYEWRIFDPLQSSAPIYRQVLTHALAERLRWRAEYEAAKARASPDDLTASSSR
jgi:replication initiator protein RepSA